MLEVGKIYQLNIYDLDYKGDGIAKQGDFFVYIKGALKDEIVTAKIMKVKKGFAFGNLETIIKPSSKRVCDVNMLGSINLGHLDFSEQLNWQKEITKKTLEKVLNKSILVEDTITDGIVNGYRNKVVFHVLASKIIKIGLYKNGEKELIQTDDFLLANAKANEMLSALNQANIKIDYQALKHITFRNNRKHEYLIVLNSYQQDFFGLEELINFFKKYPFVKGIVLNVKETAESILGKQSILLYGEEILEEQNLYISDQSFMQVNYGVMDLTYKIIKDNLLGNKIIDAYSGVGSIGYNILTPRKNIVMIENNDDNIRLATMTKEKNDYHNVTIVNDNVENVINNYSAETIIFDPPRTGLFPSVVEAVINKDIKQIIYLSCDLQTLTRDLRLLTEKYDLHKVFPIRMFPQTNSFETIVILFKK